MGTITGTSVYEEQVRVPLDHPPRPQLACAADRRTGAEHRLCCRRCSTRSISPNRRACAGAIWARFWAGKREEGAGLVLARNGRATLLGQGSLRLICARKLGACKLFDLAHDAHEEHDISAESAKQFAELRARLKEFGASHGRYETNMVCARKARVWPAAILRGISGDGDAVDEIAALLDDADLAIRRKAAELLFELKRPEARPRYASPSVADEDDVVRRYAALSLTRMGEGAPLTFELEKSPDLAVRRLAALVLAESGDGRGEKTLIAWWQDGSARNFDRSRQIAAALGTIRAKDAVWPLVQSLDDVRLRPYLAGSHRR